MSRKKDKSKEISLCLHWNSYSCVMRVKNKTKRRYWGILNLKEEIGLASGKTGSEEMFEKELELDLN